MKYINANVMCYKSVTKDESGIVALNNPFCEFIAKKECGKLYSREFVVATTISILGTNNDEHKKDNILMNNGTLDVIIRLTKCDREPDKRLCIDIDNFKLDTADLKENIHHACYPYLEYARFTKLDDLELKAGTGQYVIKVLVKQSHEQDYTIQTMSYLKIHAPQEESCAE